MSIIGSPSVAVLIFLVFILFYFIFLDIEGGFQYGFLQFGPGAKDEANATYFMSIKVDTWTKTYILYAVSFLAGLLSAYYNGTLSGNFYNTFQNSSAIPLGRVETYSIALLDPLIMEILYIIELFATITLQLQFILPGLIGKYIGRIPFVLNTLSGKTFLY
jgi:hypothetical protein